MSLGEAWTRLFCYQYLCGYYQRLLDLIKEYMYTQVPTKSRFRGIFNFSEIPRKASCLKSELFSKSLRVSNKLASFGD